MHYVYMFHDNDSQLVVSLAYQLGKRELVFMIRKTFILRCYSIKCYPSLDSVQQNKFHYVIVYTNNSLSKETLRKQTNIIVHF